MLADGVALVREPARPRARARPRAAGHPPARGGRRRRAPPTGWPRSWPGSTASGPPRWPTTEPAGRTLWRVRDEHNPAITRLGPPHKYDVTLPGPVLDEAVGRRPHRGRRAGPRGPALGLRPRGRRQPPPQRHRPRPRRRPGRRGRADPRGRTWAAASAPSTASAWPSAGCLHLARSPEEIAAFRAVKAALDPDGILNPGVPAARPADATHWLAVLRGPPSGRGAVGHDPVDARGPAGGPSSPGRRRSRRGPGGRPGGRPGPRRRWSRSRPGSSRGSARSRWPTGGPGPRWRRGAAGTPPGAHRRAQVRARARLRSVRMRASENEPDAHPVDGVGAAQHLDQRLDRAVVLRVDVDPGVGEAAEQVLEQRDRLPAVDPGLGHDAWGRRAISPVRSVTRSRWSSWKASSTPSAVTWTSVSR